MPLIEVTFHRYSDPSHRALASTLPVGTVHIRSSDGFYEELMWIGDHAAGVFGFPLEARIDGERELVCGAGGRSVPPAAPGAGRRPLAEGRLSRRFPDGF